MRGTCDVYVASQVVCSEEMAKHMKSIGTRECIFKCRKGIEDCVGIGDELYKESNIGKQIAMQLANPKLFQAFSMEKKFWNKRAISLEGDKKIQIFSLKEGIVGPNRSMPNFYFCA